MGENVGNEASIRKTYEQNWFMKNFGVRIEQIERGHVIVGLTLEKEKHFNHRGVCHGGVLAALADSVTGVTGASVGAAVATLDMNMSFIKSVKEEGPIFVESHVRHEGRTILIIDGSLYNEKKEEYATLRATMFIIGPWKE